jgi:hypothetical protein
MEYQMPNDTINATNIDRGNPSEDDGKHEQRSPAGTQQDSADAQPGEGQPEIPKVGSRDAPGG